MAVAGSGGGSSKIKNRWSRAAKLTLSKAKKHTGESLCAAMRVGDRVGSRERAGGRERVS